MGFMNGAADPEVVYNTGICIMAFLFGICIGSFLNVCIIRMPAGESLTKRNSHCMTCGAEIKRYDLIPLFSWIILGGKCRNCKAPISPRYSIVEGLTGVLFVLMFLRYDVISSGFYYPAAMCLFIAGIIVIGFQDFDTQEMCVSVLIYLAVLAFAVRVCSVLFPIAFRGNTVSLVDGLIGAACVSVPLLLVGFVFTPLIYSLFISEDHKAARKIKKRLSKEKLSDKEREKLEGILQGHLDKIKENGPVFGFGMGDIIFMAAGGLMLGWKATVVAVFIAIFLAAIAALIMKIKSSRSGEEADNAFAFGPFLAIGLTAAAFYGTEIMNWYFSIFTFPEVPVIQ